LAGGAYALTADPNPLGPPVRRLPAAVERRHTGVAWA
jgi:hypothetical protein